VKKARYNKELEKEREKLNKLMDEALNKGTPFTDIKEMICLYQLFRNITTISLDFLTFYVYNGVAFQIIRMR